VPGRPLYATRLVVKADAPFRSLQDTFGGRLGFTVEDSHSGYNALRHHLLPYRVAAGRNLYSSSIGPLTTPRRVIAAILAGEIDVGPLDSYALELIGRHDPALAARIRIVDTTDAAPIPFLVASRSCPGQLVEALQAALLRFGEVAACDGLRQRLCLRGFAPVVIDDYDVMLRWDAEARAAGYPHPG
jgi:ABC-type phosphate/phosphonate transport system substrate-binding protein